MNKHVTLLLTSIGLAGALHAQQRYIDEVFTDDQITVSSGLEYAVNIDFLTSNFGCDPAQVGGELMQLQTLATEGLAYPEAFHTLGDPSTCIKLRTLRMDVYAPDQQVDGMDARPVAIYVHNGNLLPPCINCLPLGQRTDSVAVEICRRMARSGYVAVSIDYRTGWNPQAPDVGEARRQLLNAVYRAMHDAKMAIRSLRQGAGQGNPHAIDPDRFILIGQGTGAFISLATVTLDREEELFAGELLDDPFVPTSFINVGAFGDVDGNGGSLNLYRPSEQPVDVQFSVNLGGGVVDTLWIEPGDAPMVSFHCVRDDLVPFDQGMVNNAIGIPVVGVFGSNRIIPRANALGNNACFASLEVTDPYSQGALAMQGTTWSTTVSPFTVTVSSGPLANGLYAFLRPQYPIYENEGQPWQWWDPDGPLGLCTTPCGISGDVGGGITNPDMSPAKALAYVDTVVGYMAPRIVCALGLGVGMHAAGEIHDGIDLFPNPASDLVHITSRVGSLRRIDVMDIHGRLVRTTTVNADRFVLVREGLDPGVYLIRLHHAEGVAVRRMVFE